MTREKFNAAVIATGVYLLLGTFNLLSLTAPIVWNSFGLNVGSTEIRTPSFHVVSLGLLVLFTFLNFDTLTDIYLDFKEARQQKDETIRVDERTGR